MRTFCLTLLFFFVATRLFFAQTVITDLNGFRLGQYREAATNELGRAFQKDKFEDGFEYEAFLIKPDTSLYMVFEYAAGKTDVIWSIQVSGTNETSSIGFKNLKFGMDKKLVEKILGKPDITENIGEYGEKWAYKKTNYSVEISKSGKLSSIKITNDYKTLEPDKIPEFENVVKTLTSKNNADIAAILSPAVEIYHKSKTLFLAKSFKTEIETDYSKVFQTIKEISTGLNKINTSDLSVYEENIRLVVCANPRHVIKIKKDHVIKELVFENINGQYLIWEISTR